jgi:hypothetical protein
VTTWHTNRLQAKKEVSPSKLPLQIKMFYWIWHSKELIKLQHWCRGIHTNSLLLILGLKRFSDTANKVIFSNSFLTANLENLKKKWNITPSIISTYQGWSAFLGSKDWTRLVSVSVLVEVVVVVIVDIPVIWLENDRSYCRIINSTTYHLRKILRHDGWKIVCC